MDGEKSIMPMATLPPPAPVKLAISICCNRTVEPRCELAFSMMLYHLTAFGVPFGLITQMQASLLPQARQDCLDEALADGCTHHLLVDDDIEMPGDSALRMLNTMRQHPEIDILAVNYARKQNTLQYTAEGLDGNMTESFGRIGVEEVATIGLGLAMIKLDKIRSIPAPHFEVLWDKVHKKYMGEDRYFTRKVREHGVRIFVDHGISNFTQHWGGVGYNFNMFNPKHPATVAVDLQKMAKDPDVSDETFHRAQDGTGE